MTAVEEKSPLPTCTDYSHVRAAVQVRLEIYNLRCASTWATEKAPGK